MKLRHIAYCLTLAGILTGCDGLDTVPAGSTIVDSQRNKSNIESHAYGIMQEMTAAVAITGNHNDYGIPAMNMFLESDGMDMVSSYTGYNQFSSTLTYTDHMYNSSATRQIWQLNYRIITASNALIGLVEEGEMGAEPLFYKAMALTTRAYAYFNLAQIYQFTYATSKDKPCVPIVDEKMTDDQKCDNPRKTVKEVYDFIMADLDQAIVTFDAVKLPRENKMMLDGDVAHGLRARVRLVMQDWDGALADAKYLTERYAPYSLKDVSKPTFINLNDESWIWGLGYTDNMYAVQTGIVNWPSFLCSLVTNGYTTQARVFRSININLYNQISPSDVRCGWWLDSSVQSPLIDGNAAYEAHVANNGLSAYDNVKFAPAGYDPSTQLNSQDYPLMRAEEMILIQAECMARLGDPDAFDVLNNFVKTYRDPYYTNPATNLDALLDEIWFQRRIELWGEGFAYQDLMRLNKDVDRRNSNFEADYQWCVAAGSDILLYRIPQHEIEANYGISEEDNNPAAELPRAY